jgi:hypothetical protein
MKPISMICAAGLAVLAFSADAANARSAVHATAPNVTPHRASNIGHNARGRSRLILNYRHDKWAVTPSLQLSTGSSYGSPFGTTDGRRKSR